MKRENYYILLELDPAVRDEASINDAIGNKAGQWSRDRNHPRKGTVAQKYLGMLPDIKKVLLDPVTREAEADEALKILLDEKAKNESKLIMAAKGLIRNGVIKEDDLKTLAKKFNFTEDEVERILKVRVIQTPKDDGIEMLDESMMMGIRSDLNVIGKNDLFEFLGLYHTSSCTDLVNEATEMYNKYSKNANKTAEVTATVSLSNICIQRLKDEASKEKYLKSLHYEYFGDIKELIDIWASNGSIDAANYQTLASMAEDKEIPPERANFFIYDYCCKKGLEIDMVPISDTNTNTNANTSANTDTDTDTDTNTNTSTSTSTSNYNNTNTNTGTNPNKRLLIIIGILIVLVFGCYTAYKLANSGNNVPKTTAEKSEKTPPPTPVSTAEKVVEPDKPLEPVKPIQTNETKPPPKPTICENCTLNYSFGTYTGRTVNGYPEGQGTMTYTKRVRIAKHDSEEHYAEAGYSLKGTWVNGDISNGKLIDNNGNTEVIMAGERSAVYDLEKDNK